MNTKLNFDDWDSPATPAATLSQSLTPLASPAEQSVEARAARVSEHAMPAAAPSAALGAGGFASTLSAATAGASLAPVNAQDKRIVNGQADINQLAPFKYPWAWEFFLNANKNHWTPLEVSMAQDVHDYQHKLTPAERHVFENVLAYLTTSDILAMRNIGLAVMEKMSAPELQIYQARQVYEEALHTWTYQHCIETLGIDQQEIYNRYRVVPAINGKIALANRRLERIMRSDFDLRDRDNLHEFALLQKSVHARVVLSGLCWWRPMT